MSHPDTQACCVCGTVVYVWHEVQLGEAIDSIHYVCSVGCEVFMRLRPELGWSDKHGNVCRWRSEWERVSHAAV